MITKYSGFRPWVKQIMPTVFDESLSYYELLSKVIGYLNQLNDQANEIVDYLDLTVNTQNEDITQIKIVVDEFTKTMFDDQVENLRLFTLRFELLESEINDSVLPENIEVTLDKWFVNGKLADIINTTVFDMKVNNEDFVTYVEENNSKIGFLTNERLSHSVNALYPPTGYLPLKAGEVTVLEANENTTNLQNLIRDFGRVYIPTYKIFSVTDTITVGTRWKTLFTDKSGRGDFGGTIKYVGEENKRKAVVLIGGNNVDQEPTIDGSGLIVENIVVDANNLAGFGFYGTYLTNESKITGLVAKNTLEYGMFFARSWYVSYEDLLASKNKNVGLAFGMPLIYLDGTKINWTNSGEMNNCKIDNVRAISSGLYYSIEHPGMYSPLNTHYNKGYGIGFGVGNSFNARNFTSESNGGLGLYVYTDSQPLKTIGSGYLEKNNLNSGLDPATVMGNLLFENVSATGGTIEARDIFMNYTSGGIYHKGFKERFIRLSNIHQPRFLTSLDGLTTFELAGCVIKDNVYYGCGMYNTDPNSLRVETYQKAVNTRYTFNIPIFPVAKQKLLYIKSPNGGSGSYNVIYKNGTVSNYPYPTNPELAFVRALSSDAIEITRAGAAGTVDIEVDFAIINPHTTNY